MRSHLLADPCSSVESTLFMTKVMPSGRLDPQSQGLPKEPLRVGRAPEPLRGRGRLEADNLLESPKCLCRRHIREREIGFLGTILAQLGAIWRDIQRCRAILTL